MRRGSVGEGVCIAVGIVLELSLGVSRIREHESWNGGSSERERERERDIYIYIINRGAAGEVICTVWRAVEWWAAYVLGVLGGG